MGDIAGEISRLLGDKQTIAEMVALVKVETYAPEIFEFREGVLGLDFIGVKKEQVNSPIHAFVVLFLLDLYHYNYWITSENMRTNEEQFVVKPLYESEIEQALTLCDYWVKEFFQLKYRKLNVKLKGVEEFKKDFLWWMPENAPKEEREKLEQEVATTKWVLSLFPDAFYDMFFGETEQYYFYAESGVYD